MGFGGITPKKNILIFNMSILVHSDKKKKGKRQSRKKSTFSYNIGLKFD